VADLSTETVTESIPFEGVLRTPRQGNEIAAQMRRAVDKEQLPPESEVLMLLINGASEIERLEAEVKHLQVVKP
jgi:hypothetical protein